MTISSKILNALLILLLPVAFVSCGATDYAGGGIGGTGISVGKITAFGSVWVNGVEYSTTGAIMSIEGTESISDGSVEYDRSLLDEGKIVTVYWAKDANGNPVAERIEFKDNLEGPITTGSIDFVNQTFEVLGQTIKVDGVTVYDGTNGLSTLTDGNIVEVSGFVDANGIIYASYISLKSVTFEGYDSEIELKGIISALNKISGTFMIGGLTIEFSPDSTEFEHMTIDELKDGLYVEVKSSVGLAGDTLIASKIEIEDRGYNFKDNDEFEIEGYVTAVSLSEGIFELEGNTVQVIATTQYKNGSIVNIADIMVNMRLEAEGIVDADGVLVADKIEVESGDDDPDHDSDDEDENDPS